MARTSPYGDLLQGMPGMQLPKWLFGGEFGDIENSIIVTENARRQSDGQALQNDANEMKIDEARRAREFEDQLSGVFQENKPATMRDMYKVGVEQALGQGRADIAFQMQDKLDEINRHQKQQEMERLRGAIAANSINPDYAATMMPELYNKEALEIAKEKVRKMGGSIFNPEDGTFAPIAQRGGNTPRERQPIAYNKDGEIKWVDPRDTEERNKLIKDGYSKGEAPRQTQTQIDPFQAALQVMMAQRGGEKTAEKATEEQRQVVDKVKEKLNVTSQGGDAPPRPPQPGMKWQFNRKTGEFREVPL